MLKEAKAIITQPDRTLKGDLRHLVRFTLAGAFVGIAVGLWEAGMIYFVPTVAEFQRVDSNYVIWFVAVSVDLVLFSLLGAALGCLATLARIRSPKQIGLLAAVLVGAAGAWIEWALLFLHFHMGDPQVVQSFKILLFPLFRFAIVFALTVMVGRLAWRRVSVLFAPGKSWSVRRMVNVLLAVGVILISGLSFHANYPWAFVHSAQASAPPGTSSPNLILITMDTVRADHLSAYGYGRPTTPNLDRLASQGILFENAIAPVSWTLPSLASIFTGLLPHQHGGNAFRTVDTSLTTLAEALQQHGYETAGFNANYFYGEDGWGIGQGFAPYDDDRTSAEYNLARTVLGRVAVQPIYQKFGHYDVFFRRPAEEVNHDVLQWFRNRSNRPFFLYINYLDAHAPYKPPPPYHQRFGALSGDLARLTFSIAIYPPSSLSPQERASLINGYDNGLAYLDDQIGKLMMDFSSSPDWANTIVVITADHGEAFGEHGEYTHGCDLHREEIHVPLMIFGHDIPQGKRIAATVPTRALFATELNFALGKDFPLPAYSLSRYWDPNFQPDAEAEGVVSELSAGLGQTKAGLISLTTPDWHYIRSARGSEELYSWKDDPEEKRNLSALPEYQSTLEALHAHLESSVRRSMSPWLGREYIFALARTGQPLLQEPVLTGNLGPTLLSGPRRIGTTQAIFGDPSFVKARGPVPSQEDLLKSLPYQ